MTTPIPSWLEAYLDNITSSDTQEYTIDEPDKSKSFFILLLKWILRLTCIVVFGVCPWANFKLIQFFQTRAFYKESSAKWYIIFKAVFDSIFMLISTPIIFCLTFNVDIIHKNSFTCKSITYVHYLSDDLISMMLTLLCLDRMVRITFAYRLRKRFSLTLCIIAAIVFGILNIHHIIRLKHWDGICHKTYFGIWDYDFDIYYSVIYTSITWAIIFIASLNLSVSVYCDRARRIQLKSQQHQEHQQERISRVFSNGGEGDLQELIHDTDDWDDPTVVTIEPNRSLEQEQQDNIDLQLTVCVLITSAIFLGCNLPNFIIFIMRFVFHSGFNVFAYVFVYIALFPLLIAHTISYFIFNHLAARLFPNNSS